MTILIIGSSGKTGRRLVSLLKPSHEILIASRSGADVDGCPAVKFDWTDPDTYANPYSHPQAHKRPIKSMYLVAQPSNMRPFEDMKPVIDTARAHGVKRFVLMSSIREDQTTPGTGQVHAYLEEIGVEWAVLRPTWFMENFSELHHARTIKDESSIVTAFGDGKISFVSAEDIAAVAYRALNDEKPPNRDFVVLGPELLTHDEAAALFTEILGRQIQHIRISEEQVIQGFMKFGMKEAYARRLAEGEARASRGEFAILNEVVAQMTGRPPLTLRQFIEKNKKAWQ